MPEADRESGVRTLGPRLSLLFSWPDGKRRRSSGAFCDCTGPLPPPGADFVSGTTSSGWSARYLRFVDLVDPANSIVVMEPKMPTKPFHLAWFLHGSSVQAWGEAWTGHIGQTWMEPELFLNMARALERACFDYILLEDSSYVGESFGGSTEIYLKSGIAVPRQDPSVVAALMTQVTSRIGIVPTFGTYAYHPYLLARLVATLDQVSGGRIGWNAVSGSSDFAAMNFGMQGMPEHDLRYDMADEYMDVCRGLWGSWQPGAIVADRKGGVLVDHTKVHAVNYSGKYFSTRGPLNSGPAPQGQPVIAQAGGSPRGRKFAAAHADTIVVNAKGIEAMRTYREDVHKHMVARGRKPSDCKILYLINPILGDTMERPRHVEEAVRHRDGTHQRAARAFWQDDQYRFRQVRSRQAIAR
jgi:FMN-dependent oxidoreductase (nitrilotriacetate monooxygenase family)